MAREKSEDKRQAILDAALSLFVERHFHGTAVPEIAKRAGVADGTIYRYFGSKEELVNALYVEKKRALIEKLTAPFPAGVSIKDKLFALGRRYLEFAAAHPLEMYFLERNHHQSYLGPEALELEMPLHRFIGAMLVEGQEAGLIKPARIELLYAVLYGALNGVLEAARLGVLNPLEQQEALEECLWHAIRA